MIFVISGSPKWKGDNNCDDENNSKACDYDGGDCCPGTVKGGKVKTDFCKQVGNPPISCVVERLQKRSTPSVMQNKELFHCLCVIVIASSVCISFAMKTSVQMCRSWPTKKVMSMISEVIHPKLMLGN